MRFYRVTLEGDKSVYFFTSLHGAIACAARCLGEDSHWVETEGPSLVSRLDAGHTVALADKLGTPVVYIDTVTVIEDTEEGVGDD